MTDLGVRTKTTTTTPKVASEYYTPELRALMQTMRDVTAKGNRPGPLMAAVYHYFFGDPKVCRNVMWYWFGTLHIDAVCSKNLAAIEDAAGTVVDLLSFLSRAPAAPCIRDHRVGQDQHHLVYFMPFGCATERAQERDLIRPANLMIPIVAADPRIIQTIHVLTSSSMAFPHIETDPTYNYYTFSCFSDGKTARAALDKYRAVLLAIAVRTVVEVIRRDLRYTQLYPQLARLRYAHFDNPRLRQAINDAPTYVQAVAEDKRLRELRAEIVKRIEAGGEGDQALNLLLRTFDYIVNSSRTAMSMEQRASGAPGGHNRRQTHPYIILPTDGEVLRTFGPSAGGLA